MHGWASDARCWAPWIAATAQLQWLWQCGERGYGQLKPKEPIGRDSSERYARRLVIAHSLGPHLLAPAVLAQADIVVLLASFGAFVPPGRPGRRVRAALAGMAEKLRDESEARVMLRKFLANAARPQSPDLLPPGPADGALHVQRLREDLQILSACQGLPPGFPQNAPVLVIEAEQDNIVSPEARAMLREALPHAEVISMPGAGHTLLGCNLISSVVGWVEKEELR